FARVAFAETLGVAIAELADDRAVLGLPFRPDNVNAGGVLSGGASASLVILAGTLAAWTRVPLDAGGELRCVDTSIQYLSASTKEDGRAEAGVVRRGRELTFLDVLVTTVADKPLVHGVLTYQASEGTGKPPRVRAAHVPLPEPSPLRAPAEHRLIRGY